MTKDQVVGELERMMEYYGKYPNTGYWKAVNNAIFMSWANVLEDDFNECLNGLIWWKSTVETHPKFKKPHLAHVIYDNVIEWVQANRNEYPK